MNADDQDRVVRAIRDIYHNTMSGLPLDGTIRMSGETWVAIMCNMPYGSMELNIADEDHWSLGGAKVEVDESIPNNEVRYIIERSVIVDLVEGP